MGYNSLSELFTATANAIRSKTGSTDPIVANDFPTAIEGISGGGTATLDTGRCISTKNMFALDLSTVYSDYSGIQSHYPDLEVSLVDGYGYSWYKVSDDTQFFAGDMTDTRVYILESDMVSYCTIPTGRLKFPQRDENNSACGTFEFDTVAGMPDYGCVIYGTQTPGSIFDAQICPGAQSEFLLTVLSTAEVATTYGFPGTGVYVAPYAPELMTILYMVFTKSFGIEPF